MGIRGFENRLEKAVEGTVSRLFRGTVKPVEFARKLQREMDGHRSVGVNGRTIVPNHYSFGISDTDHEQLVDIIQTLTRELADTARRHARDEKSAAGKAYEETVGRLIGEQIEIRLDPAERPGFFQRLLRRTA